MKSFVFKFSSALLLSLILFSCAGSSENDELYAEQKISTIDVGEVTYSSLEKEVLDLVNDHRVSIGLNELEILNLISSVAEDHTKYMVENGQISHDNFSERAQLLMENANAKSVSENVAFGYTNASDVMHEWLNSDSHRAAIEKTSLTHFGISSESSTSGKYYFTNIFINK